ncbi:hypothetical protein LTR62_000877 [Meristemomyces frigidus]|uniref:Uncharacterized protein n=1 Tax=Meristemomyces frigidus TaxID=1508187 RepID=A0AAN7YQU6_9PEZI|nr:hypothetical protein LTR62_000877 [Meristemomyces frigidus]
MLLPLLDLRSNLATNDKVTQLVGWTVESTGRGTLSLITNCLATTALCTWVCIHPRIDPQQRRRLPHKIVLFAKAVLCPELIAVEAAQEWTQARRVTCQIREHTSEDVHYNHAFYIGMFGLRYRTPQGTKVLWPNQLVWLLEQNLFDWKQRREWDLTTEIIQDKSKADATAKLFALLQSIWFVAQSIMRATHNLPLAPLESMTLGYIPLFVVTYIYWWLKPKDVRTPSEVELPSMTAAQRATFDDMMVNESFDDEGEANQKSMWQIWYLTSRIFEKEEEIRVLQRRLDKSRQLYVRHYDRCPRRGCAECKRLRPGTVKPKKEVVLAHWDPELYHSRLWPVTCLFGISFGALHLASWDTEFPTQVETWLWRSAAITSMGSMLLFMQFEKVVVRWSDPLMLVKICSPLLYLASRIIMLGGAIAAFRASDPRLYDTYSVSSYWAHLL